MAKPITAVVLGSALVQTIDFSINILRKDNIIYQPSSSPIENAEFLQDIIHNLFRLNDLIDASELMKLHTTTNDKKAIKKLSEAAQSLLKIAERTKELVTTLTDTLISAQAKGTFADPRWKSAREALTNTANVWKNSDVKSNKKKFRALRRETDAAILAALRQYLDQSTETGLPVLSPTSPVAEMDGGLVLPGILGKWQGDALIAVEERGLKSGKKKDVEAFAKIVDELVEIERRAWFVDRIFALLWFEELDERVNSVGQPMEGSFEWLFGEKNRQVGGLLEWLGNIRGEGVFWVTGKPGAGKTTLMKHILRNPRVFPYLETWSGLLPGIISGFFALGTGSSLQKSSLGLLRSILYESLQDMMYGPLQESPDLLHRLFADRWQQYTTCSGGLHDFTVPELRKAFGILTSDTSKKFFFVVDGLDEMGDYPTEIIELIKTSTAQDHIKFCISSHASPIFQSAFENRPRLFVDDWTKNDIHTYVTTAFNQEPALETLRGKIDSEQETNIINTTAVKASGVFLWAHLATTFLLQTLVAGDDFLILADRANALPPQLSELLAHILAHLDPINLSHIWMLHVMLSQHSCPGLLPLSFALTSETSATYAADTRPLKPAEEAKRVEDMRLLLHYRCLNLFSILDTSPPSQPASAADLRVTYTHPSIQSYLSTNPAVFASLPPQTFNVAEQWLNSHLWVLKTLSPPLVPAPLRLWKPLATVLSAALDTYHSNPGSPFPLTYIHACLVAAIFQHSSSPHGSDLPSPSLSTPSLSPTSTSYLSTPAPISPTISPLHIPLLLNIQVYSILKLKTTPKPELKAALDFRRDVLRRWGKGGEKAWIAGFSGLEKEWGAERKGVHALCEYYGRTVRVGVKRPDVGVVPEWV